MRMFLEVMKRRNPQLIEAATALHQSGAILPDTYVLDLDSIAQNAALMKKKADQFGIELFYMTKQFGRNPLVAAHIRQAGIEKAVVVDYKEALQMIDHQLPIGNVGHLVQIPMHLLEKILRHQPEYVTVYSIDMLQQIDALAQQLGINQKILVKVLEDGDQIYEGQYGGFRLKDFPTLIANYQTLTHVTLAGITSFPCFLFDGKNELVPTPNVQTVTKAKQLLQAAGIFISELNMPSATCVHTLPFIAQLGGTQGEPGHALTGTTPLHAVMDLPEKPAMLYVSEISHNFDKHAYFYGGGYYRRGHLSQVLIADKQHTHTDQVQPFSAENIDYYLETSQEQPIGATVIAAFRTQVFITRSDVAVVSGLQQGTPHLEGIFDSQGNQIRR